MKRSLFLVLCMLCSVNAVIAANIEPSNREKALGLIRSAYSELAQAQRQVVFRGSHERAACKIIAKLNTYYQSSEVDVKDPSGKVVATLEKFENSSLNALQAECVANQKWERKTATLALHDEMVRLLDQKIEELKH